MHMDSFWTHFQFFFWAGYFVELPASFMEDIWTFDRLIFFLQMVRFYQSESRISFCATALVCDHWDF